MRCGVHDDDGMLLGGRSRHGGVHAIDTGVRRRLVEAVSDSVGDIELASKFCISDYEAALADKANGRASIADAIHRRFAERYLDPITNPPSTQRHGFAMMAVSCLMIEALQSFRHGWLDTSQRGAGAHAFCSFFDEHSSFAAFRGHAQDFYKGVRCGILHQAETTHGWRIRRDQTEMLTVTPTGRLVDATRFSDALRGVLDGYRDALKTEPWDSELWDCLGRKMKSVCNNCKSKTASMRTP